MVAKARMAEHFRISAGGASQCAGRIADMSGVMRPIAISPAFIASMQ
jgi:hypothetical protein